MLPAYFFAVIHIILKNLSYELAAIWLWINIPIGFSVQMIKPILSLRMMVSVNGSNPTLVYRTSDLRYFISAFQNCNDSVNIIFAFIFFTSLLNFLLTGGGGERQAGNFI